MSRRAVVAGTRLAILATLVFSEPVTAVALSAETTTPTPPVVKVKPSREGLQESAEGIIKRGGKGKASGKTTPAEGKTKPAGDNHPRQPQRRDDPPTSVEDDLELNIGLCGRLQPDGTVPGPTRCQPGGDDRPTRRIDPPTVVIPRPEDITWEQVRSETKNSVFPGLTVKVQPSGRTLVNMATIVYTTDNKVSTSTVTLLGFPVVVQATPLSYTWDFGDGRTVTTTTPGKPYPAAEITHKYLKRAGVGLTVTTNYGARFNVANTGWQYVSGTIPITGPATLLQVREAVPVLVDPGR